MDGSILVQCLLQILHRRQMVSRFGLCENLFCPRFAFGRFDHFLVQRLQRTRSTRGDQELLDGGIRGFVLVAQRLNEPLALDHKIPTLGEIEFVVDGGHFSGGQIAWQVVDEMLFLIGRFDLGRQTFDPGFAPSILDLIDRIEIF